MELIEKNNKRTFISVIVTILFHGAILLLLFAMGLKYPDPPPPEQGVEMDLGDLLGEGNALIGEVGGSDEINSIHDQVDDVDENYVGQDVEEAPISAKKSDKPKQNIKLRSNRCFAQNLSMKGPGQI